MEKCKEISIDDVDYVRADELREATKLDGMPYVIVRTFSAGVFAEYLAERNGKEATMKCARRIWYWSGAASLSQLAVDGTSNPSACKFPVAVDTVVLTEVIEVLSCTEKARKSIQGVAVWKS